MKNKQKKATRQDRFKINQKLEHTNYSISPFAKAIPSFESWFNLIKLVEGVRI